MRTGCLITGGLRLRAAVAALCLACSSAGAESTGADWPSYNGTPSSERYSSLDQIATGNVSRLQRVCAFDTGERASFQTGLVVVDGIAYFTTEFDTFAVDAATCAQRWRHHYAGGSPTPLRVNRGVAYHKGRLFRGGTNGRLYALNAKDGTLLWETQIADRSKNETLPAAPAAWEGLVFMGIAGGAMPGVNGRIYALDAQTGKQIWQFYLVPPAGKGPPHVEDSWPKENLEHRAGGGSWSSYTLDTRNGVLYVPVGSAAPVFAHAVRPGDNLYTNSFVAIDARRGTYVSHRQLVPNDYHDWDLAAAPILVTTKEQRALVVAGGKDGHLYGFDKQNNALRYRLPVTRIENIEAPLTSSGTRYCPGAQGGIEWNGPAYSPLTDAIYVGSVDWCSTVTVSPAQEALQSARPARPWTGVAQNAPMYGKTDPSWAGWLTAVDANYGRTLWLYRSPTPLIAGVLTTAGGLVFTGDLNGQVMAFDALTGDKLWKQETGDAIGGGVVTYAVNGHQYLAVAAGLTAMLWPAKTGTSKLIVFTVP